MKWTLKLKSLWWPRQPWLSHHQNRVKKLQSFWVNPILGTDLKVLLPNKIGRLFFGIKWTLPFVEDFNIHTWLMCGLWLPCRWNCTWSTQDVPEWIQGLSFIIECCSQLWTQQHSTLFWSTDNCSVEVFSWIHTQPEQRK